MAIQKLGHVGIYARDLENMRDFYSRVVGLQIADEAAERGVHELGPRTASTTSSSCSAAPARAGDLRPADLVQLREASRTSSGTTSCFKANNVRFRSVTSHGNAVGLYFFDPEDNVCEVYWTTPWKAHQPYGVAVDLTRPLDDIKREIEADVAIYGATGHGDPESFARQKEQFVAQGIRV